MNNTIPSVVSAAKIIERLAATAEGASQSRLSALLGLSSSTCYRILQSLSKHGWVCKGVNGAWTLGLGLLPVAEALRGRAAGIDAMRGILRNVVEKYGIACKLSIRHGMKQTVAIREEPLGEMQTVGSEGSSFPLAEGSSGAVLLEDMDTDEAMAILRANGNSQTDSHFLRTALAELREKGWCGRRRIADWPISAISAPVRATDGSIVASLTFIIPDARFDNPALPPLLMETARKCELKL